MKTIKPTAALTLLIVGVMAFVLQSQHGASQSGPPPQSSTFNAHYKEVHGTIAAGGTSDFFSLPMLDRAVRLVITFTADGSDQDFSFADRTFLYRTTRGELWYDSGPISPDTLPDGLNVAFGLNVVAGTNGTFAIKTDGFTTTGSLHIGMWY
jgi:hypothetical protein